jgi:acetyltransferase
LLDPGASRVTGHQTMSSVIESLHTPTAADLSALGQLLRDAVESGASIGFMLPLGDEEIARFWTEVFGEVAAGKRVVLVAREAVTIVGSVQLGLAGRANSRHRAEVQKLLVLRSHRGRGIAGELMNSLEFEARERQRTLLVLDTSASGNALGLYARCGYTRVGTIPRFARDPDGPLIDTVVFYKDLDPELS